MRYVVVQFVYSLLYRVPRLVLMSLYSSIDGNRIVVVVCCALVINCSFIIEHILIFSSILYPFIMPRWKNTYESGRKYNKAWEKSYLWLKCADDY